MVHLKRDANSCVRGLFKRVFLLHKLVQLYACILLGCQVKYNVASGSILANNLDFLEFDNRFDHDSDRVACISTHFS